MKIGKKNHIVLLWSSFDLENASVCTSGQTHSINNIVMDVYENIWHKNRGICSGPHLYISSAVGAN